MPLIMRNYRLSPAISATFFLVACGGGGTGDGGEGVSSNPQDQTTNSKIEQSTFTGPAAYDMLKVNPDANNPLSYELIVALNAFDTTDNEPAYIEDLITRSHTNSLGTQSYDLKKIECAAPSSLSSYDALMLFDRSGSMASNDPNNETLDAAHLFVDNLGAMDRAKIAMFPGKNSSMKPADYLNTDFTSDQVKLHGAIKSLPNPNGLTPLWDAMTQVVDEWQNDTSLASTFQERALLAFSDGQDTQSMNATSDTVLSAVQSKGLSVFAINLRNSDSYELDMVALQSRGAVYSTDEAKNLVQFYGVLGQLLSGNTVRCAATIQVSFEPQDKSNEIGYGPGFIKPPFEFLAQKNKAYGIVSSDILLPLYPSQKVGQTSRGNSVFGSDIIPSEDTGKCVRHFDPYILGGAFQAKNECSYEVSAVVCKDGICESGTLLPGKSIWLESSGPVLTAFCPWLESPYRYIPMIDSGNNVYSELTPSSNGSYVCVYRGRARQPNLLPWSPNG